MKQVLAIHEITEELFSLPLENYILTFDDGLYSQYLHFDRFQRIPTQKIYFISSGIVCNGAQSSEFITCADAHQKAFAGNLENYMTVEQIRELMLDPHVTIGAHGHAHKNLDNMRSLPEKVIYIDNDTRQCVEWFKSTLGYCPTVFCYPHNNNLHGIYTAMLKKYGFTEFYGQERLTAEALIEESFAHQASC